MRVQPLNINISVVDKAVEKGITVLYRGEQCVVRVPFEACNNKSDPLRASQSGPALRAQPVDIG